MKSSLKKLVIALAQLSPTYMLIFEGETEHGLVMAAIRENGGVEKFAVYPEYVTSPTQLYKALNQVADFYDEVFVFFDDDGRDHLALTALFEKVKNFGNVRLAFSKPCFEVFVSYLLKHPKSYFSQAEGMPSPQAQLQDYVRSHAHDIFPGESRIVGTSYRKGYDCGEKIWFSFSQNFESALQFEKERQKKREADPKCRLSTSDTACSTNAASVLKRIIEVSNESSEDDCF